MGGRGMAKPAGSNVGTFEPLALAQLAAQAGKTGGPINGHAQLNVTGAGPGFGVHVVDLAVDADTGIVTIGRYTAAQDVGTAIHPSYVEGQLQGGAVQGIGWALNEEYIYNAQGRLSNPGFLDYRIPVASDLPMIETVLVEVPNPTHPYGVRGVLRVPIVPPTPAVRHADAPGVVALVLRFRPAAVGADGCDLGVEFGRGALVERGEAQHGLLPHMDRVDLVRLELGLDDEAVAVGPDQHHGLARLDHAAHRVHALLEDLAVLAARPGRCASADPRPRPAFRPAPI